MKISKAVILGFVILFFSTMTISSDPNLLDSNEIITTIDNVVVSYTTHSPVWILNNSDFITQGWSGFGNSSHPYTFSGYNITSEDSCIWIHNTTAYFEIRDCHFEAESGRSGTGIDLYNVSNGQITNNTIRSKYLGLDIRWSNSTNVTENTFEDCDYGLLNRHYSFHNILHNNTLSDITYAIYIYQDYNTTITFNNVSSCSYAAYVTSGIEDYFVNNTIRDCSSYGFYTKDSSSIIIQNNTVSNSSVGVYLRTSLECQVLDNSLESNGLRMNCDLLEEWNHTIISNTVNGKPLGYFWDQHSMSIDGNDYGQVILANCSFFDIQNGDFSKSSGGLQIGFGYYCNISDFVTNENVYGIEIESSRYINVCNVTISDCTLGLGLRLTNHSIIAGASVSGSEYDGILVYSAHENTITECLIFNNGQYGLTCDNVPGYEPAANNLIYNNTIGWNYRNSRDYYHDNNWNSSDIGNGWSDYDGEGIYYPISLSGIDYHPSRALYLDYKSDMTIASSSMGNVLYWNATADKPDSYEICRDSVLIDSDAWNGSTLRVSLDGLAEGLYNYTIFVNHTTGHFENDTVWVTVADSTDPPTIDSPSDKTIQYGQLGETISWTGTDVIPATYIVYRNGTPYQTGSWSSDVPIVVSLNGLDVGQHNMTIILFDDGGRNVTNTIWVTVEFSGYISHTPIDISGDADLITQALSEGWPGNGTADDPYIIQYYLITATSYDHCINIHDISLYVVIRECILTANQPCIYLDNADNVMVKDCVMSADYVGIFMLHCDNCVFQNVTISDVQYYDVEIWKSRNATFTQCIFQRGISISGYVIEEWQHNMDWDTHHNTVAGNPLGYFFNYDYSIIEGTEWGQIILANSTQTTIRGLEISGVNTGVIIGFSMYCTLESSTISDCDWGAMIHMSNYTTVDDCFFLDIHDRGIHLNMSSDSFIFNNTINATAYHGISASMEINSIISNNTILNTNYGVRVGDSVDIWVCNNTVKYNEIGISIFDATNILIFRNQVLNCADVGIKIGYCTNCEIYYNEIGWNDGGNAQDDNSNCEWDDGISRGNAWSDHSGTGYYYVPGSSASVDHYPSIINVPELDDTTPPVITELEDIEISEGLLGQAINWTLEDEHPSSYEVFRNGSSIASGLWNSGIESVVIAIDGLSLGVYNFTLLARDSAGNEATDTVFVTVVDDASPILNHPVDITYSEGEVGNSFTWTPTDTHPDYYEIYRNDTIFSTANWTAETNILMEVDGLSVGNWNYTIIVFDDSGNSAVDTVMVNVIGISTTPTDTTPTSTTPTTTDPTNTTTPDYDPEFLQILMFTVTIGSVVVIIVFVILIFRSRK